MVDIFISYRRAQRDKVEPIKQELEALGLEVFFDIQGVDGGADFPNVIDHNLRASKAVLACWSAPYFERRRAPDWCLIECRFGLKEGKLIPVAIERFDGDVAPVDLHSVNYFDLSDWRRGDGEHEDWVRTLRALSRNLDAAASVARGDAHAMNAEYGEAVAAYDEAIRLNPEKADAYFKRGLAHHGRRDYNAAIADYTEVIRLDPKRTKVYFNRGQARACIIPLSQTGYDAAIADYSEAIRLDPQNVDAVIRRADAYRYQENYSSAVVDYSEAIRLDPQNEDALTNRARTHEAQKDYTSAIADYTEAMALNPHEVVYPIFRGIAYRMLQDYTHAIADFTDAIEISPVAMDPLVERGIAYREQQDWTLAIADFTEALRRCPGDRHSLTERGVTHYQHGNYGAAISDYTEALGDYIEPTELSSAKRAVCEISAKLLARRAQAHRARGNVSRADADDQEAKRLWEQARLLAH